MRLVTSNMEGRKLFVSFKMAEVCNLACPYCYFFFKGDDSSKDRPSYMSLETVEASARFLGEGARDLGIRRVEIALHGGEPLMVGKVRFKSFCEALTQGITPYAQLKLAVQTNGVLLDEEWIRLFSELNVHVSISIDGPKHVHDAARPDKKGRGSYDRVVRGIKWAQWGYTAGLIDEPGTLAVVNPNTSARELYEHLVHELKLWRLDFMLPKDNWDNYSPKMLQFIEQFSLDLMNCWLADDNPKVNIRSLKQIFAPFLTDLGLDLRRNYLADLTEAITIRSNGEVSPDDTLPAVSKQFRHTGHSVATSTLQDFYSDPLWNELRATLVAAPEQCAKCEWFGFCGGGEIVTRYSSRNGFDNPTIYCERNKILYNRVTEYMIQYIDRDIVADRTRRSNEVALATYDQAL